MPQGSRRCDACDNWQAVEQGVEIGYGGCRRYPPQLMFNQLGKTPIENLRARWPSVKPDDWCGEWKQAT